MDHENFENPMEEHSRTIIHIDIDCFYAQVEILKNPNLKNVPLGIQQKNIVVTSNYIAREYGIKKCMQIVEAKKLCPELVLANGEDLKDYREMSSKVHETIRKYSQAVEKLGLDENFIDVSILAKEKLVNEKFDIIGNKYENLEQENMNELCYCGCRQRLSIGTQIANEIRQKIFTDLGLTTCAGISYNKMLAKLVGSTHKPNQQTVLFPENVQGFLRSLKSIRSIPGIGYKTYEVIKTLGIQTIPEVLDYPTDKLQELLGKESTAKIVNLCRGYDPSPVKSSGKPLSIGLEDSCRNINGKSEVEIKFKQLLTRLIELVAKDGRIPTTLKVTVRKFDKSQTSHREQKQTSIPPSIFTNFTSTLTEKSEKKILLIIMKLFHKIVDVNKPFHITLLGLSFTKFLDRLNNKNTIASFLMKNVTVQAVTNLQNNESITMDDSVPDTSLRRTNIIETDGSESEVEPSPKKSKIESFFAKRRCLSSPMDSPSPSKLRVAELRLNSMERINENEVLDCPPGVDPTVFSELPSDVQQEIVNDWKNNQQTSSSASVSRSQSNFSKNNKNSILNYLITDK
ncbi:DNA polymerase iota [Chrysoperla carnea]|uniref:DNA polymerase iota n=1 Tax=Chrysoperla carnea TaxID=189513 RepID=UPI001D076EE1|nr:DNA polymerase iota [Chrysoperla carnea]